jgi:hypothetical protein
MTKSVKADKTRAVVSIGYTSFPVSDNRSSGVVAVTANDWPYNA